MRLDKHDQVVLSKYKTVCCRSCNKKLFPHGDRLGFLEFLPCTKGKISFLLVCQVKTTCTAMLSRSIMSFYSLYNASKEAYVFVHSLILSVSSCVRINRRIIRAETKALPSTPDARDRDEGVPNPWFTGPPNFPFSYSNKKKSSYGSEINGNKTNTFRIVY